MKWLFLIVTLWLSQSNLQGQTVVSPSLGSSKIIKDSKDNLYRVNVLTGKATYMGKTADNMLNRDNRIRDTLKIKQSIDDIYVNAKKELLINGKPVDGMLSKNTLIQGTDGEEYVYTGEEIMGKKEFLATGGSSRLMENYNKEKEEKAQPDVAFNQSPQQKYGFDAYTEQKINIQNNYPELKSGYRPAFKSVESFAIDKVKTNAGQGITFRDEMGILPTKTADELTFRGSTNGSITALYAYKKDNDTTETIAGKLNLLSFDKQNKKVYLVPVNGATLPDINALRNTLNKVYAQAVTDWTVETKTGITVTFAGGQMTHGGSNAVSVYNTDQKAVIKTFGDMEKDALYLFFVKNVQSKDGDIGGYMPLQRQAGFIYELPNNEIIAHELGHGAFNLRHTFSTEDNAFIVAQNTTDNLMDYKGGTELWMHQWKSVQEPERVWLSFLEDESEGEMSWTIIDAEHTKLFNYIYDNKLHPSNTFSNEPPTGWTYGDDKPEVLVDKVIAKLKKAEGGKIVEKITLRDMGIYIGEHTVGDKKYPTAIYSRKKDITNIKKVVITDVKALQTDSIKKHFYCESTYQKYLVLAFYEEGDNKPVLMIQAAKDELAIFSDERLEAWMKYVGVMEEKTITNDNKNEIVLNEDGSWWVSQYNASLFSNETCWDQQCCNKAANKILGNAKTSTSNAQKTVIAESSNSDCSGITGIESEFKDAIRIIDKSLFEHKLPIMVGVHHPKRNEDNNTGVVTWYNDCAGNTPNITNHYIVIRGKKYDSSKKQYYYLFYEVGTTPHSNGKSMENRLYINNKTSIIEGKTAHITTYSGSYYIVTEVRKNIDKTY